MLNSTIIIDANKLAHLNNLNLDILKKQSLYLEKKNSPIINISNTRGCTIVINGR